MKAKLVYVAPATGIYLLSSQKLLLGVSGNLKGSFVSDPGVGGTDADDVIGTESRRTRNESWSD